MNIIKLEAAATLIHARARKFAKLQIAAMTAATMGLVTVTVATFSQETATPDTGKAKAAPMTLPTPTAQPMWIESKDGRKIAARVMARDNKGITVQRHTATGYEEKPYDIPWEDLGPSARQMLDGEKTWEEIAKERSAKEMVDYQAKLNEIDAPRREGQEQQALINEKFKRLNELRNKFSAFSAKEQQQALIENGRDIQVYLAGGKRSVEKGTVTHISPIDAGKTIVIPDTKDEVVSLRPEFEKLGVTATQQIGDTCTTYSTFHLMQFVTRKNGVTPATIEKFSESAILHGGKITNELAVEIIAYITGKPVKVTWIQSPLNNLNHEITKDLLRRGIPSIISWRPTKADGYEEGGPSGHASVVVGFRIKDGATEWEILDSNHIEKNAGYKFIGTQGTVGLFGIETK